MMSREFTSREKILLLVLCVLLLGIAYYEFIIKDVDETIKKYDTEDLETELLIEQTRAQSIMDMEAEMKNAKDQTGSVVASYNNIKNEISALNDIFSAASTYNFDFSQAIKDGDAVRRDISVSFTAGSYNTTESIIAKLHGCKYRCLIRNISINTSSGEGISSGEVSVSMTVTFFETMYNANTTDGLEENKDEGKTTAKTK
ncbi:Uncharacterised protein [uncultured Eubacterium sp.]|nr:Uncharacterised protein [uncultured Eubacterium sp.]